MVDAMNREAVTQDWPSFLHFPKRTFVPVLPEWGPFTPAQPVPGARDVLLRMNARTGGCRLDVPAEQPMCQSVIAVI